jgi:hypothetical protein
MLDDALFVGQHLHVHEVPLPDGTKAKIHFKELAWPDWYAYQIGQRSEDPQERLAAIARMLAASVCDPDGSQALTVERALQLRPAPMNSLLEVVLSTHGKLVASAKKPSPSAESSGSGTSSPSPSAQPSESLSAA